MTEANIILLVLAILCIAAGFIYGQHLIKICGEEDELDEEYKLDEEEDI